MVVPVSIDRILPPAFPKTYIANDYTISTGADRVSLLVANDAAANRTAALPILPAIVLRLIFPCVLPLVFPAQVRSSGTSSSDLRQALRPTVSRISRDREERAASSHPCLIYCYTSPALADSECPPPSRSVRVTLIYWPSGSVAVADTVDRDTGGARGVVRGTKCSGP